MRSVSTLMACFCLHGCAAFGVHSEVDRAEATLLATHTLHDYEVARAASSSALARLEGSFQLDPGNENLMILLADAWVTHTELFLVDAHEAALAKDSIGEANYQRARVKTGFERAGHWGLAWLGKRVADLDTRALSEATLEATLIESFDDVEDATALLVLGHAFLGAEEYSRAPLRSQTPLSSTASNDAGGLADKYGSRLAKLGAVFLRRSIELDETVRLGSAHSLLGTYFAGLGADEALAQQHFQRAELLAQGKYLLTHVRTALSLYCKEKNRDAFERELDQVLRTGDPIPEIRLDNAVAKRRASRWLVESELSKDCSRPPKTRPQKSGAPD